MFGCVVAGRPVQTNMQQIDETHAIFELHSASTINHICVFITEPFPEGYGATVHFNWPGKGFQLLGALANEKPSAIFRLRGSFTTDTSNTPTAFTSMGAMPLDPSSADVTAILGIAIEPVHVIQGELASMPSSISKPITGAADPTFLAERVVKHLFNYLSSFATNGPGLTAESYIQLGAIQRWYESFLAKVRAGGIGFLERDES